MSETVASCQVTIKNPEGIHARPATLFVKLASRFQSTIEIVKDSQRVDGKSILAILALAAEQGTELSIEARGPDADQAAKALSELVSQGFAQDHQVT